MIGSFNHFLVFFKILKKIISFKTFYGKISTQYTTLNEITNFVWYVFGNFFFSGPGNPEIESGLAPSILPFS